MGPVDFLGGEQGAAEQSDDADADQPLADLGEPEVMAVGFAGELLGGGRGGQQMQKSRSLRLSPAASSVSVGGRIVAVDDREVEVAVIGAGLHDGRDGLRMGNHEDGQDFLAADQALADQVLLQLAGFGGKTVGDAGNAAVEQRRPCAKTGAARRPDSSRGSNGPA